MLSKLVENLRRIATLDIGLLLVLSVGTYLRFQNLGYSDYQGDEIRAQYIPIQGESFLNFLLRQRKGPIQFIVSYFSSLFDPSYRDYFFDRLPFALAAVLSLFFFYKFLELVFSRRIALIATMFMAINGFFVALSRILQYQGFVFLFCALTLYLFALLVRNPKKIVYLYGGMLSWGLSMLTHYDGIFIAPMVAYLLFVWIQNNKLTFKKSTIHILASGVLPALLLITFYGALLLSISAETKNYWAGRLTGTTSSKSAGTSYLFKVYQPFLAFEVYISLILLGIPIFISTVLTHLPKISRFGAPKLLSVLKNGYVQKFAIHSQYLYYFALYFWLAFPLLFMEKIVQIPGTHVYTYLIPLFVIMAVTIDKILDLAKKSRITHSIILVLIIAFFMFTAYQSHQIFVDNKYEYPWENEKFLTWEFTIPDIEKYHLSLFGFPYHRNWRSISDFVSRYPNVKAYTSNENNAISNYYMRMEKSTDKAGFYVYIRNPQTFKTNTNNEKYLYWASKYDPIFTISRYGEVVVNVYLMEPGTKSELILRGY